MYTNNMRTIKGELDLAISLEP